MRFFVSLERLETSRGKSEHTGIVLCDGCEFWNVERRTRLKALGMCYCYFDGDVNSKPGVRSMVSLLRGERPALLHLPSMSVFRLGFGPISFRVFYEV